jgi:hypothetical protein
MAIRPALPAELDPLVAGIGSRVTSADLNVYETFKQVEDRSYRDRSEVEEWTASQKQDRKLRTIFASVLLVALFGQVLFADVSFMLIASDVLHAEEWVAAAFFVGVFGQVTALVAAILKYLFPSVGAVRRASGARDGTGV